MRPSRPKDGRSARTRCAYSWGKAPLFLIFANSLMFFVAI